MRWLLTFLSALAVMLAATSSIADEPARFALLIGNKAYKAEVGPLKNPHNDVAVLESALTKLKFKVTIVKDATYRDMDTALKRHITEVRKAGRAAISFFYYSGHGIANPETQINYLIPTDVTDANDANLWHLAFEQNDIIDKLNRQAPQATHYVVFDACRNELRLSGTGQKALGAEKGFVPVAQTAGLLIAYATAPKQTASDVGDKGGPYATALAAEIVKPDIEAVTMFRNVQLRVKQAIGQDPWLSFPSLPEVYLAGRSAAKPVEVAPPLATAPNASEAAQAWDRVKDTKSTATLEAFVRRFGDTFYGDLAKARLEELKAAQVAIAAPPKQAVPPTKHTEPAVLAPAPAPKTEPPKRACTAPKIEIAVASGKQCIAPGSGVTFRDCADCPEMLVVPAGSFTMGSTEYETEKPPHKVTIASPIAVGKFEVTFAEWDACVADGACKTKPGDEGWGRGKRPVINVSWNDITDEYLPWLNGKLGPKGAGAYRLLTEAEWEYAARASTTTKYFWGNDIDCSKASYSGGEKSNCFWKPDGKYRGPKPVGSFKSNAWGLHDMHGNVWECVEDCWHDSYKDAPANGTSWSKACSGDSRRVARGGSWTNLPQYLRSALRDGVPTGGRYVGLGFRVGRTLAP